MKIPGEKQLQEKISKLRNKFGKSMENIKNKFNTIDCLEQEFKAHETACDELTQGMPLPDDKIYPIPKVILDSNQKQKAKEFNEHLKAMTKCKEQIAVLLKQVNSETLKVSSQSMTSILNEKEYAKAMMLDIVRNEAFRIAQEKINNRSGKQ